MHRRHFLGGLLGLAGVSVLPRLAFAKAPEKRLILLVLEGAVDGLALCPPHADPNYARARGHLALPGPERPDGVVDLDGFFGLHPSLAALAGLYDKGELGVVHATGQPGTRRSHFEALDMLHQMTAWGHVASCAGDASFFGTRFHEQDHVAGHNHNVEGPSDIECRQIRLHPLQFRRLGLRLDQHVGVDIAAGNIEPAAGELDSHSPGPTAGVQHRSRLKSQHEIDLAVRVLARSGHLLPLDVVARGSGAIPAMPRVGRQVLSQRE